MSANSSSPITRFGTFELDFQTGELRRGGQKVKLQEQPFQVLSALLEHPGKIVTREELRSKLWPAETFVDFDHSLNAAIKRLRDALNESADAPVFIETLARRGYRFIAPVNGSSPPGEIGNVAAPARGAWKRKVMIAVAACFVIAGLLHAWTTPSRERLLRLAKLQRLTEVPLTTLAGTVLSPTFSPDGSQIAFAWDGGGIANGYDLYVKAIGADKPLRLTYHPSDKLSAAWSPDGRSIAISRGAGKDDSGIYLIPPTGGPERKLATRSAVSWFGAEFNWINWSPDGKQLAFVDHPANAVADATLHLFRLSLETLERTQVDTGCESVSTPTFSPGGKFLAWVCYKAAASSSLWLLRLKDGDRSQLLSFDDGISGVAWSRDERRIVFSSIEHDGAVWEVSLARPMHIERLPTGHDAEGVVADPAGRGLAYVRGHRDVNIWRLDLLKSPPRARMLVASSREDRAPSISPDESKIAFESSRTGANEVWVCEADGSNAQQLTDFGLTTTGTPRWSPDGKLIAFDSRLGGEANIYIVDPRGGVPHKLSIDLQDNSLASWSHDAQWIYFLNGDDAGTPSVWKVPSSGGHAVLIAKQSATFPLESPDGKHVYFVRDKKLWQVKTDGSMEQQVERMPELNFLGDEWFPVASGIYFIAHEGDRRIISLFDLQTKQVRPIFTLEKPSPGWIGGMPVSAEGKWLLFPQKDERSSELMLIENWR
jgi:Tol biopolymer transport system component/DNA-binding winged helix-turn-helix (wHTH) protein